jgi:hypothetical protein
MTMKLISSVVIVGIIAGCSSAPSNEKVSETLKPIMPEHFSVTSVEKLDALDGLYEVVVTIDSQPTVIYLDKKLKHVISGSVVEISSKKNLTYAKQAKLKTISQPHK